VSLEEAQKISQRRSSRGNGSAFLPEGVRQELRRRHKTGYYTENKEVEKEQVFAEYKLKEGEIITGVCTYHGGGNVIVAWACRRHTA